jgi:hypothetical protein
MGAMYKEEPESREAGEKKTGLDNGKGAAEKIAFIDKRRGNDTNRQVPT